MHALTRKTEPRTRTKLELAGLALVKEADDSIAKEISLHFNEFKKFGHVHLQRRRQFSAQA